MAHRVSFDHNSEEETNAGAQAMPVAWASTSTKEASGAVAVAQAEVAGSGRGSRGAAGRATVCEPSVQSDPRQESESDPEESDDYDEDDLSISDQDTSDSQQEEAAPSVAAAAPPLTAAAAAIQIPGPHRSRPRRPRRRRKTPFYFAEWQVEELENLFEKTQYPDVLTRYVARTRSSSNLHGLWFLLRCLPFSSSRPCFSSGHLSQRCPYGRVPWVSIRGSSGQYAVLVRVKCSSWSAPRLSSYISISVKIEREMSIAYQCTLIAQRSPALTMCFLLGDSLPVVSSFSGTVYPSINAHPFPSPPHPPLVLCTVLCFLSLNLSP